MYEDDDHSEADRGCNLRARYHICGGWSPDHSDGEIIEPAPRRSQAFSIAARMLGPRRFGWVEVFDTMARHRQTERWGVVDGRVVQVASRL